MVASGCRRFDDAFAATTAGRLGPVACGRLEGLLSRPKVLAGLKTDPGPLGLDTLLAEIGKLSTVRALGLDEAVFGGASDRIVAAWRARAARMYPSDFGDCPEPVRYALLGALCWTRQAELVDSLVEPLIGLIHRINARAERRVEKELIGELANVPGKRGSFHQDHRRRPRASRRHSAGCGVPGGAGRGVTGHHPRLGHLGQTACHLRPAVPGLGGDLLPGAALDSARGDRADRKRRRHQRGPVHRRRSWPDAVSAVNRGRVGHLDTLGSRAA